jgi:hypothetical protein
LLPLLCATILSSYSLDDDFSDNEDFGDEYDDGEGDAADWL